MRSSASVLILVAACSLQIPSEDEVFGGASGRGGSLSAGSSGAGGATAGAGAGSSATSGGSAGSRAGGGGQSGATSAGASGRGGSPSAGTGGRDVTTGGSGGSAPSSGGTAGEGGEGNGSGSGGEIGGEGGGSAGLVAQFPFDEDSGAVVANAVDSSKPATCAGTCSWPEGRHGRAVGIRNQADNTDWIELPPGLFRGLSAASVAVWVRDLSTARQGGRLFHFSAGPDEEIYFAPDDVDPDTSTPGSHLAGRHRGSSFVDLWIASPILTDKEWHHVVVSWNSASLDLYVDGARRGSVDSPEALPSDLGDTGPDYLGRSLDEAQIALYAEMDDLRVYARALDAGEVAQLFTEP